MLKSEKWISPLSYKSKKDCEITMNIYANELDSLDKMNKILDTTKMNSGTN